MQKGDTAAREKIIATAGDMITPQRMPLARYPLVCLAFLLLVGCEFDTQNPGLIVSPTSGLLTSEDGDAAQFTIALNSKPDAMVTIAISSSNTNEGTVNPVEVSFTASDWSSPKTVSVTGVDDDLVDGDIAYSINFQPTQSGDSRYNGLSLNAIAAVNQDNDSAPEPPPKPSAGVTITPNTSSEPLSTSENQTSATFSVVLNSQPASDVTINAASSDLTEGLVSPLSVTFTPDNWANAVQFTVTGVDDDIVDGTMTYTVGLSAQSADSDYNAITIPSVQLQNTDNDSALPPPQNPGVTLNPDSGLVTSENQTASSFSVILQSMPSDTVTINVTSSDITEGLAAPGVLTFSPGNWNVAQTVTVTGVDDFVADNDINYSIDFSVQSPDANYNGLALTPITAVNQDNDSAGITLSPPAGLITSEDLTSDTFTVVLNSQPTASVTIAVTSSDTSEGSAAPGGLTFTTGNWNSPQTVTVSGADDALVDGNVSYTIDLTVQSADANYNAMVLTSITAVNQDNDSAPPAGISITPTAGLQTSENLTTDTFSVVLNSQPTNTVTISISSNDTGEGTVAPGSVSFTTANWNLPQTVTISGVDDALLDGTISYSLGFSVQSVDSNYNGFAISPLTVDNLDNDTAGISITPPAGLITSENLISDTFTVALNTQPTNAVTITITSNDTSEATVSPGTLTFNTTTWNTPQTVTVSGVDDALVDGNVSYNIDLTVQSADANYNAMAITPISAVNQDNDSAPPAGISVTPRTGLQTSEDLGTDTFTVVLNTQPTNTVTIALTSSDTSEGQVSPANLSFTTGNWNTPQTATISGVNDFGVDGNVAYTIGFTVQSTDSAYNAMALTPVSVVNQDNDSAAITATPASGLIVSEDLTQDTFSLVLTSQPTAAVNITLTSSDISEATVAPANMTFTTGNWNSAQTVTISGVDDTEVDGDTNFTITFSVQSTDANYNAMALNPVSATNQDNDTTAPPNNYVIYIEPGIINIAASTITGAGATQLPAMGYALTNAPPGSTPGPVIEAVVGQTTTIEVVNDHINPHRFEIEGLLTNTAELLPGETRQFQITPTTAGVYRYGDPQLLRRALGLQGAVVVRPAGNANTAWTGGPAFDQERTWVISDFDETWLRSPSTVNLTQYNPNYFLLNGKSGFAAKQDPASTIDGTVGETFLIRIVNAGQFDQSLHFHSNHFQIISEGGFKYTDLASAPVVTTINVKRGSTAMVLFTMTQIGTYPVHVHTAQMETGNGIYLNGTATLIIGR